MGARLSLPTRDLVLSSAKQNKPLKIIHPRPKEQAKDFGSHLARCDPWSIRRAGLVTLLFSVERCYDKVNVRLW